MPMEYILMIFILVAQQPWNSQTSAGGSAKAAPPVLLDFQLKLLKKECLPNCIFVSQRITNRGPKPVAIFVSGFRMVTQVDSLPLPIGDSVPAGGTSVTIGESPMLGSQRRECKIVQPGKHVGLEARIDISDWVNARSPIDVRQQYSNDIPGDCDGVNAFMGTLRSNTLRVKHPNPQAKR